MALHVSFMNQCVTWLCAEFTKTLGLHIFITSCLRLFAIFSIEMVDVEEQRVYIKFCFKLGNSAENTHKILQQALGDACFGSDANLQLV